MTLPLRRALLCSVVVSALSCSGAPPTASKPVAIRLVDLFDAKRVQGSVKPESAVQPTIWRFDGAPPAPPPPSFADTRGWEPGPGIAGLTIKDGQLTGRTAGGAALIHLER